MAAREDRILDRRAFLRGLGAAGVAAGAASLLSACGSATSPPAASTRSDPGDERLRVGYLPITDATPLLIAHGQGFYADQGLQVDRPTLLRSWSQVAEAFQSRKVDLVHLLMPMTVWLRFEEGFPLKVVAWNHTDGSALTVSHDITSVEQLAGTTVAVPFWYSIHNVALQMLLGPAGLTPILRGEPSADEGTVKLVVMAPPDMPPALANETIAGYIVADPFNAVAEIQDIGHVLRFTGDLWLDHACCVAVMHEDAIAERPQWAQRTVNALVAAQRFTRDSRAQAAGMLAKSGRGYLPQPLPAVERALTHYGTDDYIEQRAIRHPDWHNDRIGFQPFPFRSYTHELVRRLRHTEVEGEQAFLVDLDPSAAHEQLVNESLVRHAIDVNGGPGTFDLPADLARTETIDV